jgi:16S rRNA C1402 (ribose-2'-O) methylase RsmI
MFSTPKLQAAKQKLYAADVPFELRVIAYLRLSCSALRSTGVSYTGLLQALSQHNREWLSTCNVTKTGMLTSSDRIIDELLKPIKTLHQATQVSI